MKKEKTRRTRVLKVRLTPDEEARLNKLYTSSTCQYLSEYVRNIVLNKPTIIKHRNTSLDDFMSVMKTLVNELNAIGNNYNQVVKRLHTLQEVADIKTWLLFNESARGLLLKKMDDIRLKIGEINDIWLR